jgi:hypothetical protein
MILDVPVLSREGTSIASAAGFRLPRPPGGRHDHVQVANAGKMKAIRASGTPFQGLTAKRWYLKTKHWRTRSWKSSIPSW